MKGYVVYCLVKDLKPCYVGVTTARRLLDRIIEHRGLKKDFDTFVSLKHYKTKKDALIAENAIIKLNSIFDLGLVNGKILMDEYKGHLLKQR